MEISQISVQLDEFDRKIIALLQREGRISITELAARVGLSKTPCQIRLKRLLAEGVILGFEAVVDPARLGMEHVAFAQVRLSATREQALQEFGVAVRAIAEVEECHMIAANFDYLLKVRTANIQRYRAVLGEKKIYTHEGTLLNYPALPAIQFFDDDLFPWLGELEAATDTIQGELDRLLEEDIRKFRPYVAYEPGTPVNQWQELNHSERWSGYFLWEKGAPVEANCARCPKTAALMEQLPLVHIPGFAPTVMFSVLLPHTHIPPHAGVTNTRLIGHLPLIVPDNCRFRVGNETRKLVRGKAWLFDDSIEHEAWNDSDETRIILMIDVWNPHVSEAERPLIRELLGGMREYYRDDLAALG